MATRQSGFIFCVMVESFSPSVSFLLCKFDAFCTNKNLSKKQIDVEAKRFFAFCMAKGWENCVFPEYLSLFAQGKWCPFIGHCKQ